MKRFLKIVLPLLVIFVAAAILIEGCEALYAVVNYPTEIMENLQEHLEQIGK